MMDCCKPNSKTRSRAKAAVSKEAAQSQSCHAADDGASRQEYSARHARIPVLWGLGGAALLLFLYFSILAFLNSPGHAWQEFARMWYWMLALAIGFGVQIGLFVYVRQRIAMRATAIAATGGVSGASMVACCLHHMADFLPLLGLSAAAVFFTKYQTVFIIVGIISNLVGMLLMLRHIAKHRLYDEGGAMQRLVTSDTLLYVVFDSLVLGLVIIAFFVIRGGIL